MQGRLVSVIVPTKNSGQTLASCLASILAQTYKPLELVVVDNHSTDNTAGIAKKYTRHFYVSGPERSPQRNFGVHKAKGTYVAIIDSDMRLSPTVIEEAVNIMEQNSVMSGVVFPEESFGEGFWAQCKKLERSFYTDVPYMEAARFFRKSSFVQLGGYNEDLVSGEDWDLSQRMEAKGELGRTNSFIYHNEGHISLWKTVQKKYYYAQKFSAYKGLHKADPKASLQTGIIGRYWIFFSRPGKLFRNPVRGVAMLFMKTCEFGFGGAGYIAAQLRSRR